MFITLSLAMSSVGSRAWYPDSIELRVCKVSKEEKRRGEERKNLARMGLS